MDLVSRITPKLDNADVVIMVMVEQARDRREPATPGRVHALIGGSPYQEIARRLDRLRQLNLLQRLGEETEHYAVTDMGAELLSREAIGWSPSPREQHRRDRAMRDALAGAGARRP